MRTDRFCGLMEEAHVDVALITHMVDLYYFTGTIQPGFLVLSPGREPLLLVRKAYQRAEEEVAAGIRLAPIRSPKDLPGILEAEGFPSPRRLGLELDVLPYLQAARTAALFPEADFVDVGAVVYDPIQAGKSRVEDAGFDVAGDFLGADEERLDFGVVHCGVIGAAGGHAKLEAGLAEESEGGLLEASFWQSEAKFHVKHSVY